MARFFVSTDQFEGEKVFIEGDDAHHITRVLRLQVGNTIECVNEGGQVYLVEIEKLGSTVVGLIREPLELTAESPLKLSLFQGLAKGDKMDWVVQKAVELGVFEVIPFQSQYTVVKLDQKKARQRVGRWEKIAHEAAKQAKRTHLPKVQGLLSFSELLVEIEKRHKAGEFVLLAYEGERNIGLSRLRDQSRKSISVLIGPEGGFSDQEVEDLVSAGAQICSLGPRILRTETAGIVALSLLGYIWGDLG